MGARNRIQIIVVLLSLLVSMPAFYLLSGYARCFDETEMTSGLSYKVFFYQLAEQPYILLLEYSLYVMFFAVLLFVIAYIRNKTLHSK